MIESEKKYFLIVIIIYALIIPFITTITSISLTVFLYLFFYFLIAYGTGKTINIIKKQRESLKNKLEEHNQLVETLQETRGKERVLLDNTRIQFWYLLDPEFYGMINKKHAEFMGINSTYMDKKMGIKDVSSIDIEDIENIIARNRRVFKEKKETKSEEWIKNAEGDKLLKKVSQILKKSCRTEDIIGRWGGDEFVILLANTGEKECRDICYRIKKNCYHDSQEKIPISIALGYATKEELAQDINEVLKQADDRMYDSKLIESKDTHNSIMDRLLDNLEKETRKFGIIKHHERVAELAVDLGRYLNLIDNQIELLKMAASIHDIGMIAVSREIINKKENLNKREWEIIKDHSENGYRIARATDKYAAVAEIILYHHEWWNGEGYPRGISEKSIPLLSRIISIVEAYDVMTHNQTYKKAVTKADAIQELKNFSGIQFDLDIVNIFINNVLS